MKRNGFTIVELLIVIVVIAILAAISIVAYNGIQQRAREAEASTALSQAKKKLELYKIDNSSYPTSGNLSAAGITDTDVSFQYTSNGSTYCITGTATNVSYKATESSSPTAGGCAGHGQGGVAAITNLTKDPSAVTSASNFYMMGVGYATFTSSIASDRAHNGSTSLKRTITGAGTIAAKAALSTYRLTAGSQLSWSLWVYSTRAGTIYAYAEGSKVSDASYAGCGGGSLAIAANTWTKIETSCTASVDMDVTGAGAYGLSVQAGDSVWFDEFMVTGGATHYAYADGDSNNWAWNGTANNSSSSGPPV